MYIYIYIYIYSTSYCSLRPLTPYGIPNSRFLRESAPLRRTSDKLGEVASQLLRQLPMVSASSERALLSELERCQSDVAVNFVQKVRPGDLVEEFFVFV